jgi:O-antigen biosynthesis protein
MNLQNYIYDNNIKQLQISSGIVNNNLSFLNNIKYHEYENNVENTLFVGMYTHTDYNIIKSHKGNKWILWTGKDIDITNKSRIHHINTLGTYKINGHICLQSNIYDRLSYLNLNPILIDFKLTLINQNKFVFIISSYNNSLWYLKNLDSIKHQTYKNWRVIYVDDKSNDNTYDLVNKYINDNKLNNKIKLIKNDKNYKQGYSRYIAFKECDDNEICCLLDGDDLLYDNSVLEKLNNLYNKNDISITYGKYRYFVNNKLKNSSGFQSYPETIIENNSYQHYSTWIACHMRTGYAQLFKSYPYEYLLDFNDELISASTDVNEMMWILCNSDGKHMNTGFLTYIYNKDASLLNENSYYNKELNKKTELYRNEIMYYISLNDLKRYEKKETILIFTDLKCYDKRLQDFCDLIKFKFKLIFKNELVEGINDIKINIDHILFYDYKNINTELVNKLKDYCSDIKSNNISNELEIFNDNDINSKLGNIKILLISSGLIHVVQSGGIKTAMTDFLNNFSNNNQIVDILSTGIGCYYNKNINVESYFNNKYNTKFNKLSVNKKEYYGPQDCIRSYEIYKYIIENKHKYNNIIFHDYQGLGYYTCLAKKMGLINDIKLICFCHGNKYLSYYYGNKIMNNDDYFTFYLERKTIEYADEVVFVSDFYKSFFERFNITNKNSNVICNYSQIYKELSYEQPSNKKNICFISRLEILKGLDLYIDFINEKYDELDNIYFIGNEVKINNILSNQYIRNKIPDKKYKIQIFNNFNSYEWIEYIKKKNLFVIYPSLGENSPLVIKELLNHKIPFISSDLPGIKEIINDKYHNSCLFKTNNSIDLIDKYNKFNYSNLELNEDATNEFYLSKFNELLKKVPIYVKTINNENPLVSVIIPTINRYTELIESLNSIKNQTYKNIEIIISDDGSDEDIISKLKLLEDTNIKILFNNFKSKGKNNNEAVKSAKGYFILFFDDDDIAYPNMIEKYIYCYNYYNYDIMSCFANVFIDNIKNTQYISMSVGDCIEANIKNNLFGKGTFIIKKDIFNKINGYIDDNDLCKWVDFRFYVLSSLNKLKIMTYPGPLYYYRKHSKNSIFYTSTNNNNHILSMIKLFNNKYTNLLENHFFNKPFNENIEDDKNIEDDESDLLMKNLYENKKN